MKSKLFPLLFLLLGITITTNAKQWVVFTASKAFKNGSLTGHAYVTLIKENVYIKQTVVVGSWGFYPKCGIGAFGYVESEFRDDIGRSKDITLMVEVSDQEFEQCLAVKAEWERKKQEYNLFNQNCVSFLQSVAQAISRLKIPSGSNLNKLPQIYLTELKTLNNKLNVESTPGTGSTSSDTKLSDGALLLFKSVKTRMPAQDKNTIFDMLSAKLGADGNLLSGLKQPEEATYNVELFPVDLNSDGSEEIFVSYSFKGDYGRMANTLISFMKNSAGSYKVNLDFSSQLPDVALPSGKFMPVIVITGGGFINTAEGNNPVYTWNGENYRKTKTITNAQVKKMKLLSVDELSEIYQSRIK